MNKITIYLTFGRPGEGKTVDTMRTILKLFREYKRTERRYPELPKRQLWCNLKLSKELEEKELGKHLFYWENPKQLRHLKDCDIIMDEVQNYCPADGWADLPRWFRKLFAQHRHRGIRIFATTQDYKAVDINFRRMIGKTEKVDKIFSSRDISATLPPPKFIYGLIAKREYRPDEVELVGGMQTDNLERVNSFPRFFFLTRELIDCYDTTQDIPPYLPDGLEHVELECLGGEGHEPCGKVHVSHKPV